MAIESPINTLADLNPSWPSETEPAAQGDNHIRLIKDALKKTFANISAVVTATADQINYLTATGLTKADLQKLADINSSAAEINKLSGNNASAADLTKLSQITATAAEVNKLSGVQTILTNANYKNYSDYKASTLDGQTGSFYRDADNINAGLLAPARIPRASLEEAQAGTTGAVVMTPQRTKNAVDTFAVPALANMGAGDIGSLALLRRTTQGTEIVFGTTYGAGGLRTAGFSVADTSDNFAEGSSGSSTVNGNWRALGSSPAKAGKYPATLFVRIS